MKHKTIEEKSQTEEWGAWKFVSDMLGNPDESGIYPTSKCYEQMYDFVVEQKEKARQIGAEEERERIYNEALNKSMSVSWVLNGEDFVQLKDLKALIPDNK